MSIQEALRKVVDGRHLTEAEMTAAITEIMDGGVEPVVIGAFLTALRMKGEQACEIVGAAQAMRRKAEVLRVAAATVVDTCGTGGDGADTFNISTAAAFVVAGAGITVAKHGNRAVSSKSGSADVLKCLGVNIEAKRDKVEQCLERIGIGFLFAPMLHPAMKHAAAARKSLGFRTIFNLLGPLTNPAGAHAQVIGVYDFRWTEILARVLKDLGLRHALVVHGGDGLDEITLTTCTRVSELKNGEVRNYVIEPEQFGLKCCAPAELKGGTPEENAAIIRDILAGKPGARRDIVLLNAAAAIMAGGKAETIRDGLEMARKSVDSGAASRKLDALRQVSNS
jgi:anthranilate phosphoribosyltransferase